MRNKKKSVIKHEHGKGVTVQLADFDEQLFTLHFEGSPVALSFNAESSMQRNLITLAIRYFAPLGAQRRSAADPSTVLMARF